MNLRIPLVLQNSFIKRRESLRSNSIDTARIEMKIVATNNMAARPQNQKISYVERQGY